MWKCFCGFVQSCYTTQSQQAVPGREKFVYSYITDGLKKDVTGLVMIVDQM